MANENNKIYALDLSNEEWILWLKENLDEPKFRAAQITQWLWQKHVYDVDEMTNLSKELRDALKAGVDFALPELLSQQRASDGTRKFLWRFRDGETVESVLLKQNDRLTACISTQVGCPLQCIFCATGLSGYVRNLTVGEIAAQFLAMEKIAGRELNNVVYMGMGEPFLNTENVLKSVRLLNDPQLRNLGIRHFTISTSGVIPGILQLANSGLGVRLAVSLHTADEELRGELMPIDQRYPLVDLREAMEEYQKITNDRVSIEYALFGGVNDSVEDARELVRFLRGIHVFINLIPFNAVDGRFEKPTPEAVLKFRKVLETAGFESQIRMEQGADIDAACGQLRRKAATGESIKLDAKPYEITKREPKATPRRTPAKSRVAKESKPSAAKEKKPYGRKSTGGVSEERTARKRRPQEEDKAPAKRRPQEEGKAPAKRRPQEEGKAPAKRRPYEEGKAPAKRRPQEDGKAPAKRRPQEDGKAPAKSRKTDKPEQERYRSGKMKEERPAYKGQRSEEDTGTPERKPAWFDGARNTRKKAKKPAVSAGRRSKTSKPVKKKK